jgi:hypothetical protein
MTTYKWDEIKRSSGDPERARCIASRVAAELKELRAGEYIAAVTVELCAHDGVSVRWEFSETGPLFQADKVCNGKRFSFSHVTGWNVLATSKLGPGEIGTYAAAAVVRRLRESGALDSAT